MTSPAPRRAHRRGKTSGSRRAEAIQLLRLLAAEPQFAEVVGLDVSARMLEIARARLDRLRLPPDRLDRVKLLHGALTYRDARIETGAPRRGLLGSFVLGFAFAFGWTPCIGPILTAILLLAARRDTVIAGMFLLAVYSAGLAIPFLLTGLGLSQFLKFYGRFRKHLQAVEVASGVLLIAIGVLMAFNKFTVLSGYLSFLNRFTL